MKDDVLVAEFAGWTFGHHNRREPRWKDHWWNADGSRHYKKLRISDSWELLMPVVKKINESTKEYEFDTEQYVKFEEIFDIDYTLAAFMNDDIKDIYNRCVEYVKWHNDIHNIRRYKGRLLTIGIHSINDASGVDFDLCEATYPRDEETGEYMFDSEPEYELFGDWVKNEESTDIQFIPKPNAKFFARYDVDAAYVEVYRSNWAIKCKMCSPCYPNCGDVDSPGDEHISYILPPRMLTDEWLQDNKDRIIKLEE